MKTKLFKSVIALVALMLAFVMNTYATKHVLHMENVYNTTQHFCISYPNDTIVLYEAPFCGSFTTTWKVDNIVFGYGDSLVYVPMAAGTILVTSDCGTPLNVFLNFYTAPPSHATFSVMSGGSMNSTNDTLWMCGTSVSVLSNTIGSEATSYTWYTSGGLTNSSDDPIILNVPGMHVFERINPCGVTRDTFYLVQLPTEAPVWTDMTFCNAPVNLTLDPGPGWNYLWNTGETTQTLAVSDSGFYKVKLSNQCVVLDSAWIQISQVNFPLPDLALYSQIPAPILCQSEVAILDPNSGYTYDTYQWRKDGVTPVGNQPTLTVDYALGSGYYSIEVTQGACSASSDINVIFYADPQAPTHCVSSFDPLTGTNMTVFEAINEPDVTEYVLMYKQGSTWIPVDTVAETGLSSYTLYDEINDPNQQSQTYSVFARHTCGNFSPLGDGHKTIRTTIVQDFISGDYILMILDDYATLSGYTPDSYTIWIDSLNDGNFTQIGILNGGNRSFTIDSPVNGAAYYASVNLPWNCGGAKSFPTAFSNRKVFTIIGIADQNSPISVSIYPNPASDGIFHVEASDLLEIVVTDQLGRVLASFKNTSIINLSGFAQGVYYARVSTSRGSTVVQLMVK